MHSDLYFLWSQEITSMKTVDSYKNECLFSLWQTLLTKVSTWLVIEGVLVWIPYYLVANQIKGNHAYPQQSQIN